MVGHNVRRLRRERGTNQEQLAHDAEVDVTYLRGIERGRRNPSLMLMARIAGALDAELVELLAPEQGGSGSLSEPVA